MVGNSSPVFVPPFPLFIMNGCPMRRLPNYTAFLATKLAFTPTLLFGSWLCPSPLSGHHSMLRMHISHLALHTHSPASGSPKVSGQNPKQFGIIVLYGIFLSGREANEPHHSTTAMDAWQHA